MLNVTNIPAPRVPLLDARTGLMSREWYRFFLNLFAITGSGSNTASVADLQGAPANAGSMEMIADLQGQIDGLNSAPPYTPPTPRVRYGSFYDTTTQVIAVINTAYAMTLDTSDISNGISLRGTTSKVYTDTLGVYNIQFSAQLNKTNGGTAFTYIWLRRNGVDVPQSASQLRIQGASAETVAGWDFLLSMNDGDYFEIMWASSDIHNQLLAQAATAFCPAIPSVIVTVTNA